jgi:hypothetical protein
VLLPIIHKIFFFFFFFFFAWGWGGGGGGVRVLGTLLTSPNLKNPFKPALSSTVDFKSEFCQINVKGSKMKGC